MVEIALYYSAEKYSKNKETLLFIQEKNCEYLKEGKMSF